MSSYMRVKTLIFLLKEPCKLGQTIRYIDHGPQILSLRPRITTEISNVEWNKRCIPMSKKWWVNIHMTEENVPQMENKSSQMDCQQGKKNSRAAKERIYLNHSGPFPIVFFLLPPSTPFPPYPFYIPLQVQSSPLFSLFFLPFSCLSVSLCELVFGGISVAGPHPSQTTAWMVPCSVQSSALQFCHNEHQICGGWRGSPPQQWVVLARRRKGEAIGVGFLMGWTVPCLPGGNWGHLESVRFQGLTWSRILYVVSGFGGV